MWRVRYENSEYSFTVLLRSAVARDNLWVSSSERPLRKSQLCCADYTVHSSSSRRNKSPRWSSPVRSILTTGSSPQVSEPYISRWPRGSNIRNRRYWSKFCFACARCSINVPVSSGKPESMIRVGSPEICISTQEMDVNTSPGRFGWTACCWIISVQLLWDLQKIWLSQLPDFYLESRSN